VAQWERKAIAERTKAALQHKKAKGEPFGHWPLGYDVRLDGVLVPNQAERAMVERIRRKAAAGKSVRSIASALNAEGIKGKEGGRFYASTIRKILQRSAGE
jgi:DNA invertase Pin-like site-specific DNA recombinase